jgi:transcriptional regulator with XRE-family HTH domain
MKRSQKLYRLLKRDFPGESDKRIAERLGLSSAGISGWRNGTANDPDPNNVATVAEITHREVGALLAWLYGADGRETPEGHLRFDPEAPPP